MKNNKGVTLIALTVTIIVLLILASITIFYGKENIDKANLENLQTNMLLIEAKAKEYCEEANFKVGTSQNPSQEEIAKGVEYLTSKGFTNVKDSEDSSVQQKLSIIPQEAKQSYQYICVLTLDNLKAMGLKDVEIKENENEYIIGFNITSDKVEIYSTKGHNNNYSLSEIEALEE